MGVNTPGSQSPQATPGQVTPQQAQQWQQLQALRNRAATPYSGTAAGGATANVIPQLTAALMARQRQKALLAGNPNATQQPLPLAARTALDPNGAGGMQGPVPLPQAPPQQ